MLLRSDGRVERLDQGGPVVGLIELAAYQAGRTELRAGDRLLAYTDGLSEAMNPQAEEWGEERMLAAYRNAATLSSAEANTKLVADADAFAGGAPQHDDMTVVTLHVGAPDETGGQRGSQAPALSRSAPSTRSRRAASRTPACAMRFSTVGHCSQR